MSRKLRIGIFIDHDIMIRHFIHSKVFSLIIKKHKVDFFLPPVGHRRVTLDPSKYLKGSRIIRLSVDTENRSLWGRLAQVMVMRPRFDRESIDLRRTWRLVTTWKAEILHTFLGLPIIYKIFRKVIILKAKQNNTPMKTLLNNKKYDLLINPGLPMGYI